MHLDSLWKTRELVWLGQEEGRSSHTSAAKITIVSTCTYIFSVLLHTKGETPSKGIQSCVLRNDG